MKDRLDEISKDFVSAIKTFDELNPESKINSFEIDCNRLDFDFHNNDITKNDYFESKFEELKKVTELPSVYWFEFDKQEHNPVRLFNIFKDYKENITKRNPPAIYKHPKDTNVLYLGKSKRCLWGRLILHLGFHVDKHSQGLILNEWAHNIDLNLKFNYCVFNKEMIDLISVYELRLAQHIKPLIGKHS